MKTIAKLAALSIPIVVAACDSDTPTEGLAPDGAMEFVVISGNGQEAEAGTELPAPVVVRVRGPDRRPVEGQIVNFVVTQGDGSVYAGRAFTNSRGFAQDWWTLGPEPGTNRLEVRAVNSTTGEAMVFGRFQATGL